MGLCVQVGGFYEDEIDIFNPLSRALIEAGLPPHREPRQVDPSNVFSCSMWGYSGLHYLRRLAAYVARNKTVPRTLDGDPAQDAVLDEYYDCLAPGYEHLLLHSDSEGFYAPIKFEEVIFPSKELSVPGGMVGSSVALLEECKRLAIWLELPLDIDPESEDVWNAANKPTQDGPKWQQFGIESFTCIRLIRACEASIKTGAAVVFC